MKILHATAFRLSACLRELQRPLLLRVRRERRAIWSTSSRIGLDVRKRFAVAHDPQADHTAVAADDRNLMAETGKRTVASCSLAANELEAADTIGNSTGKESRRLREVIDQRSGPMQEPESDAERRCEGLTVM